MGDPIRRYRRLPSASYGEGALCVVVFEGSTTFDRASDRVCRAPQHVSLEASVLSRVTPGWADGPTDDWVADDDEQIRVLITGGTVPDRGRREQRSCGQRS